MSHWIRKQSHHPGHETPSYRLNWADEIVTVETSAMTKRGDDASPSNGAAVAKQGDKKDRKAGIPEAQTSMSASSSRGSDPAVGTGKFKSSGFWEAALG